MSPIPAPTLDLERCLASEHHTLIVGFDEVGRGALAGPVMVGAVALWANELNGDDADAAVPRGLADSKLLTARRRQTLVEPVHQWCAADAVGQSSNTEIDEWGISHALGIAALRALRSIEDTLLSNTVEGFESCNDVVAILDGPFDYITPASNSFDAPEIRVPAHVTTHVKADQLSACVAAASILAKVTRDRLMVSIALGSEQYARYGWGSNMGYGSKAHRDAIAQFGVTPLHRTSWHLR